MRIVVKVRGIARASRARYRAAARLRDALARWAGRIEEVFLTLEDENGPKGGPAIQCLIRARMRQGGELIVRERADDAAVAAGLGTQRIRRLAGRWFERAAGSCQSVRPRSLPRLAPEWA